MTLAWIFVLGLAVGGISGVLGIGGGVLLVPGLMYLFDFSQHEAQGTTLAAMVPPIGLFAAIQYYRQGFVNPWAAVWIALGFAIGAFITAGFIRHVSPGVLSHVFGALLLALGVRMILFSDRAAHVAAGAIIAWLLAWISLAALAALGRRHGVGPRFRATIERAAVASPPDGDYQI